MSSTPAVQTPRPVASVATDTARRALPAASRAQPWIAPALAMLAVCVLGIVQLHSGEHVRLYLDDLAQLAAPALAAACATWAALRHRNRLRAAWALIALASGGWAGGQLIWCWYELVLGSETPFPSIADAGYLTFAAGSAVGLLLFPALRGRHGRMRWFLDSCTLVCALFAVSWSTSLGAVAHAGGDGTFAFAVSLAYPIGDILVLSMALSALCRPGARIRELALLSVAMIAMAVADSAFTYLNAIDAYRTGGLLDLGWVVAFVLLAVAGWNAASSARRAAAPADSGTRPAAVTMLPYLPLIVAAAVLAVRYGMGKAPDGVELGSMSIALGLLLLRQYLTVRENRDLIDTLAAREAQLHRQAFHDLLTGLANRALFSDRVHHALELHRRDSRPLAVLFCDLDDFKMVNDTLGHGAGDELLKQVAVRLRELLRPGDTVARLGGDEFAVLLEHGNGAAAVAERLVDCFSQPVDVADLSLTVRASIGLAELGPTDLTPTADELLAHADIAMYAAKRAGKGRLARWHAGMTPPNADDLRLRQPLTAAVTDRRIEFAYQPIVRLADGSVLGYEALARWSVAGQPISPARFIPVAQRAGLLGQLTEQVLDDATAQLSQWSRRLGHDRLRIGVNVPAMLMTDPALPALVARVVDRNRLQPAQLVIEITEDALVEDFEAARRVALLLRDVGARLCIDDFGKGYSSLVRLQQIPLQSLKIDKSFIQDIDREPEAERFAAALIALAGDLGLDVVAEGIERAPQAALLRRLGSTFGQGFLFARPKFAGQIDPRTNYADSGDCAAPRAEVPVDA